MQAGNQPIYVLKEGTQRSTGRDAARSNIMAARAIADAVKTTLGPKGMDKMLVDGTGDVVVTNDGAAILGEIDVEHPAAKMLIEVAKAQDEECGDGTTTSVVLAGELLGGAESLLDQGLHEAVIVHGYKLAADKAVELLRDLATPIPARSRTERLEQIAATSLGGKSTANDAVGLAALVVEAAEAVAEERDGRRLVDLDAIQIQKADGARVDETELIDGIILDKERVHGDMPVVVEDAKVALVDAPLEVRKTEVSASIEIKNPAQLNAFLDEEARSLRAMVDKVIATGATVLVSSKGIDDVVQHHLSKAGIFAVRRAKKSDLEKLAKATGGTVVSSFDDLSAANLGNAGFVEERKVGDDRFTFVTDCKNPKAVSLLLRGGTEHVVAELERAMHDALSVVRVALEEDRMIPGGGASAMEVALQLRDWASRTGGREQMAVEAFADALESIPRVLAENAGLDEIDVIMALRKAHKRGQTAAGIDVATGGVADMFRNEVVEPLRVGVQAITSATEAATMILRIDDVIASKAGAGGGAPPGGMPPGMGGMGEMPGGMPMM